MKYGHPFEKPDKGPILEFTFSSTTRPIPDQNRIHAHLTKRFHKKSSNGAWLKRDKGDTLCKRRYRFRSMEPVLGARLKDISCKACLRRLEKLGIDARAAP